MSEPVPIEGYLMRRKKNVKSRKRVYVKSCDHYLFVVKESKAVIPPSNQLKASPGNLSVATFSPYSDRGSFENTANLVWHDHLRKSNLVR